MTKSKKVKTIKDEQFIILKCICECYTKVKHRDKEKSSYTKYICKLDKKVIYLINN
jgi:hypothetical protein